MIRSYSSLILALALAVGCRSKTPDSASHGGGSSGTAGAGKGEAAGAAWATMLTTGNGGFLALANGGGRTYALVSRKEGVPVMAAGKQVATPSQGWRNAMVVLDAVGRAIGAGDVVRDAGDYPPLIADRTGALLAIDDRDGWSDGKPQGALAQYQESATPSRQLPITGFVRSMTRTASGSVWAVGREWGTHEDTSDEKCHGDGFLARRTAAGGFEAVTCDQFWTSMHVAAIGEDVAVCASTLDDHVTILGANLVARTFVARIGADATLKWVKAVNELGKSTCEDLVATSDGDIVVIGAGSKDFDLTEDATAKGMKGSWHDDNVGETLYLERFAPDGTRRWAHAFGSMTIGGHPTLTADTSGNAIFAANLGKRLDLGAGPVGPDGGSLIVTVDREAKVIGMLQIEGRGGGQLRAVTDDTGGLVLGFGINGPTTVGKLTITPDRDAEGVMVIARVPLPLPPPPK